MEVMEWILSYSLYFDEPGVEDQRGIWWYDLSNTSLSIAKVRGDGDPTSLPQAHVHQTTVHASNNTTMAQRNNVWRVVVKTAEVIT